MLMRFAGVHCALWLTYYSGAPKPRIFRTNGYFKVQSVKGLRLFEHNARDLQYITRRSEPLKTRDSRIFGIGVDGIQNADPLHINTSWQLCNHCAALVH